MNFINFSLNLTFLNEIQKEKHCSPDTVLITIPSSPTNFERRRRIRDLISRADPSVDHLVFFFMGKSESSFINNVIELEAEIFSDIIIVDFVDSYKNLSAKVFSLLTWKEVYCPETRFLFKTDDDTVFNLELLQRFIDAERDRLSKSTERRIIYGNIIKNARPKRQKESKWFLNSLEYAYPYFPDYCNGASCLFTKEAIKSILYVVPMTKYLWIDDVLFMGIIPDMSGIQLIHMPESFGSVDLMIHWQPTCDFTPNSGVISFYMDEVNYGDVFNKYVNCPPVNWFWKYYSAWQGFNLELFFGY